jgi:Domain of unknown function (DUF4124)
MHPRRPWILRSALVAIVMAAVTADAAVIYKWKDAEGVMHYSDQPVEGAEKIVTGGTSTYSGAASVKGLQGPNKQAPQRTPPTALTQISISSPQAEQSFFGDEPIPVSLDLSPALSGNQTVTWMLNGAALQDQPPTATQFTLQSLARGTYSLSATVMDADTGSQQSTSVTFYVRQPSALSPQHRGN